MTADKDNMATAIFTFASQFSLWLLPEINTSQSACLLNVDVNTIAAPFLLPTALNLLFNTYFDHVNCDCYVLSKMQKTAAYMTYY